MNFLGYFGARLRLFYHRLNKKVEPGEGLVGEWYFFSPYENDSSRGKPLKVIRKVFITTDPEMGKRPCIEVELPNGKKKFYLDPNVSGYDPTNRLFTKEEAEERIKWQREAVELKHKPKQA